MKKRNVLLSSIITIVLCLGVVAGSTFALFTSEDTLNIEVTSGNVTIDADITDLQLWSVEKAADGTERDENGKTYKHSPVDEFTNGGTAVFNGALLSIQRITPGDKVSFNVPMTNTSNVKIQYRYIIECVSGYKLMDGLVVTIDGTAEYTNMLSYTSEWKAITDGSSTNKSVEIELPVDAGNEYQNKATEIKILVEAVQLNADVDNSAATIVNIPKMTDAAAIGRALTNPDVTDIFIGGDVAGAIEISGDVSNKNIWVDGNDAAFTFKGNIDNVVIDGIVAKTAGTKIDVDASTGELVVVNSSFISASGKHAGASIDLGANTNIVIDNCTFDGNNSGDYAISNTGSSKNIKITNSTFKNFTSWAILVNNTVEGDLIVDNCMFITPDGVLKTLGGGVTGNFTFTNNSMIGCKGHDENPSKLLVSGDGTDPIACAGTKTMSNNILDGVAWDQ